MIHETITSARHPIKMWTENVPVEVAARAQLFNVAELPFIHSHLAVMPDVHLGKGATVGSVIPTIGALVPAAVGVDIGCGMCAVLTNLTASDLPDSLAETRTNVEAAIPVGMTSHDEPPPAAHHAWYELFDRYRLIEDKHPKFAPKRSPLTQVGTLGGGNHFIELCLDREDRAWVMLHSGSRGVGNKIGTYFIGRAREETERLGVKLVDRDLSYLEEGSILFDDYVEAVGWAQDYAAANRRVMLERVLDALRLTLPTVRAIDRVINCHHNYVQREEHFGKVAWITRKGAIRAGLGELGLIPGSMGTRSYVVRGRGNPESFCSCSHGAGRRMSRSAAKRTFTIEDHAVATAGVECRKDAGVIDETPGSYKSIEAVMAAQTDLVEVVQELKQVMCVKG